MNRQNFLTHYTIILLLCLFLILSPRISLANSCPVAGEGIIENYSVLDHKQQFDPWVEGTPLVLQKKIGFLDPWGEPKAEPKKPVIAAKPVKKPKPIKIVEKHSPKKVVNKKPVKKKVTAKKPIQKKQVKKGAIAKKKTIKKHIVKSKPAQKKAIKKVYKGKQLVALNKGTKGKKGKALIIKKKEKTTYKPVVYKSVFSNYKVVNEIAEPRNVIYYNREESYVPTTLNRFVSSYTPPVRKVQLVKQAKKAKPTNTVIIDKHTTPQSLQECDQGCATSFMMFIEMFKTAQDTIMSSKYFILDKLADAMIECPTFNYVIETHSDPRGKSDYNQKLSEKRAASIQRYLISKGVKASQFKMKAYGESRPVNNGTNADDYASNRRVVVTPMKHTIKKK